MITSFPLQAILKGEIMLGDKRAGIVCSTGLLTLVSFIQNLYQVCIVNKIKILKAAGRNKIHVSVSI